MRNNYLFRPFLVLLMFGMAVTSLFAQTGVVTGRVTAAEDGAALPGVNILIKGTGTGTTTDIEGNYRIEAPSTATLVFSFVGYTAEEIIIGNRSSVNVSLTADIQSLSEVVVIGYGTQQKKEITSAVVSLDEKSFNRGNINDPTQLLQGKVAGLSVYNKGGDPNSTSTIRLRGISTVGANTEPLVVIDGVIGASLNNVDPNDIESINVLKDGSASAIYGSRGSSGVILVTTKGGKRGAGVTADYNGYIAAATVLNQQPNMSPEEYIAAGGNDLGFSTDWQDEVTRTGFSNVHNVSIGGGAENTTFRMSANFRDVNGVLKKSGFDQSNIRASINHFALNDKLQISFNTSLTNRETNFSFNEALRYAVLFNPTAPILNDQGNFFQAILFDNFNPVAILEQNQNVGKRKNLNFNVKADYNIHDNFVITANYGQQYVNEVFGEYYPRTSLFRGFNRGGLARRAVNDSRFTLFETYGTYSKKFSSIDLSATAGYSFQEDESEEFSIQLGNFPSDILGFNILESSGDRITGKRLVDVQSNASPQARIIAFFGRVNLTFDDAIYFNASLRQEGSTKLGKNNQWGLFPAVGVGVDLTKYLSLGAFNVMKFRAGYGVTGSLPNRNGLAQDLVTYNFNEGGFSSLDRAANDDLKWEEKAEINIGLDFGLFENRLSGSLDVYSRDINDFILEREVDVSLFETNRRFENAGKLNTQGIEFALNYDVFSGGDFGWNTGVVLSSYKTILKEFIIDEQMRANLGSPGQNSTPVIRVQVGEEIGQIWGPVFSGEIDEEGRPIMSDINGDGILNVGQGSALLDDGDFTQLGSGIPDLELGWTNQLTYKKWDFNAFFRAAFGHSLVNTYRAFYEPIDPGAINSYNRIKTENQLPDLTVAQFSSLYVEKADFFRLDNATLGYNFAMGNTKALKSFRAYFSVQNAFTITGYSGIDPDPVLQDLGSVDNGGRFVDASGAPRTPDVLSPGIDRRNNYFTARTFTLGVNIGF